MLKKSPLRGGNCSKTAQIAPIALKKRVVPLAESLGSKFTINCNVENKNDTVNLFQEIKNKWSNLDFVVHAIAFSDRAELSGEYLNTTRDNFIKSMVVSCFSFTEIAKEASKIMGKGSSLLTLTYAGSERVVPNYNVMGVAKAALETSIKYLAVDLGDKKIRVNGISLGPMRTLSGAAIKDSRYIYNWTEKNNPLGKKIDFNDLSGASNYLLSNQSSGVTGEIHYVDAGYNIIGMIKPPKKSLKS